MVVTFKFLVGANGTFCVFFRAAGWMEKDLMRGPSRTLLVSYHHSSLLCRNVQWRDKELASLPCLIIRKQCSWAKRTWAIKCVRLWNLTAVQLCRLSPLWLCLYVFTELQSPQIPKNYESFSGKRYFLSSLIEKLIVFSLQVIKKSKKKTDLLKLKKFLTFIEHLFRIKEDVVLSRIQTFANMAPCLQPIGILQIWSES